MTAFSEIEPPVARVFTRSGGGNDRAFRRAARHSARVRALRIAVPVLVVVAAQDHVVDESGAAALVRRLEKSPSVRYVRIENSAHIMPRDRNHELVAAEVTGFIERTLGPAAVR